MLKQVLIRFWLLFFMLPASSIAHELLIRPQVMHTTVGKALGVAVYMTEVFVQPGRMPPDTTALQFVNSQGTVSVELHTDVDKKRFHTTLMVPDPQAFFLVASSQRDKQDSRQESYARAYLNSRAGDDYYQQAAGLPLEILLLDNPATLDVSDTLRIQVMYNGQQVAAPVLASYDGYSEREHAYVQRTRSDKNGLAEIELSAPGLWMLRSKLNIPASHNSPTVEISASIVFEIRQRVRDERIDS